MLPGILDLQVYMSPEVQLLIELLAEEQCLMAVLDLFSADPELTGKVDAGQLALAEEDRHGLGGAELQEAEA